MFTLLVFVGLVVVLLRLMFALIALCLGLADLDVICVVL